MDWRDWITVVFLALGCFLDLTGAIGILRMPDFYTRLHPAGKSDTLAQLFIVIALLFQYEETWGPPDAKVPSPAFHSSCQSPSRCQGQIEASQN